MVSPLMSAIGRSLATRIWQEWEPAGGPGPTCYVTLGKSLLLLEPQSIKTRWVCSNSKPSLL